MTLQLTSQGGGPPPKREQDGRTPAGRSTAQPRPVSREHAGKIQLAGRCEMAKRSWCQECGTVFRKGFAIRSKYDPEICEACDQVACTQCGSGLYDRADVDDAGVCDGCRRTAAMRLRREEIIRRLTAWVVHDGTRQKLASRLAAELRHHCGKAGQS